MFSPGLVRAGPTFRTTKSNSPLWNRWNICARAKTSRIPSQSTYSWGGFLSDLDTTVRGSINQFLTGSLSAEELNDSLPDGWDLDEANDPVAADLVLATLAYLSGYQAGDRDIDSLREALAALLSSTVFLEYRDADLDVLTILTSRVAETIEESAGGDSSLAEGFELSASQNRQTESRTTTALLGPPRSR